LTRRKPARRSTKHHKTCSERGPKYALISYGDVVRDYQARHKERGASELRHYARQPSLSLAVKLAVLSETEDRKRHPHQRRLSASTLRRAHAELDQCQPGNCSSFDELFQMVDNAIGAIHGIGPLTVYDTAYRIGEYLNLKPERIYLHAGTREGAQALGLGRKVKTIEVE
jgi:hypothetical protein